MTFSRTSALLVLALAGLSAQAQEATIRRNLVARLPNLPAIEAVTPVAGTPFYEVLLSGNDIVYTDAKANVLLQGSLYDTQKQIDLTEARLNRLNAIPMSSLPQKGGFQVVLGNGKRHIAVFADPNCGFCKRFEADLRTLKDLTITVYLYPILGEDSRTKARNVWCAKDRAQVWSRWMLENVTPPTAQCDASAIEANVAFGKEKRITGTPATILANGTRVSGAVRADQLAQLIEAAK